MSLKKLMVFALTIATASALSAQELVSRDLPDADIGSEWDEMSDPLLDDPASSLVVDVWPSFVSVAGDVDWEEPFDAVEAPDFVEDSRAGAWRDAVSEKSTSPPIVGSNYIELTVGTNSNAQSGADYIYADFGPAHHVRLWADGGSFAKGEKIRWNLNGEVILEFLPHEYWDRISLRTVSTDGLYISRLRIVHSSQEILDWTVKAWLDKPNYSHLGLAAKIVDRKLDHFSHTTQAVIHTALLELGKTDGYKYGTGASWCSEFASWSLRHNGWDTPIGNVNTDEMCDFFASKSRLYNQAQILNSSYSLAGGDYLALFGGDHSALFVEWVGGTAPSPITSSSAFKTIEGNTGSAVRIRTRRVRDIHCAGSAR